ncbi:MAG: chromosome segregation protein SMC [bacterium]|nr:chromosome segregation protein SMC [bacterium]
MFLKKLTIFGFKSFAEKVEFEFQKGITAIVGPNGCGKSNISEALKWVLGEQSTSVLRCNSMTDVIFNGSQHRKSIGMAEVTIEFDNSSRLLPLDFSEITITRRLFRSGECEYYINKSLCRLKDIVELFLDTGIGKQSYSLMEQNKVDFILTSKPATRRLLFEEAAGISKYKVRKQEAIGKLEHTEQNLIRINDLLYEIGKQVESLKRQANKANRYLQLKTQIESQEITLLTDEFFAAMSAHETYTQEHDLLSCELDSVHKGLIDTERELDVEKEALKQDQQQFLVMESSLHKTELQIKEITNQQLRRQEKESFISSQIENISVQINENQTKKQQLSSEVLAEEGKEKTIEYELKGIRLQLSEKEDVFNSHRQEREKKSKHLEHLKTEIIENLNKLAHIRNQITTLRVEHKNLVARQERIGTDIERYQSKQKELSQSRQDLKQEMTRKEARILELKQEFEEKQREKTQAAQGLKELEASIIRISKEQNTLSGRLQTLKKLQESFEGYSDGVKAVCSAKLNGVHGLISSLLNIPEGYEKAVEVSLGECLQAVVVDGPDEAKAVVSFLLSKKAERVNLLLSRYLREGKTQRPKLEILDGAIGWMAELVTIDDRYQGLIDYLLTGMLLVDNLETAIRIIKSQEDVSAAVTLDGQLVTPAMIRGGSPKTKGVEIISRKGEITRLEERSQELSLELNRLDELKIEADRKLSFLTNWINKTNVEIYSTEIAVSNMKKQMELLDKEESSIVKMLVSIEDERLSMEKEKDEKNQNVLVLSEKELLLSGLDTQQREKVTRTSQELQEMNAQLDSIQKEVSDLRVSSAQKSQAEQGLKVQIKRLKDSISDLANKITRLEAESTRLKGEQGAQCANAEDDKHRLSALSAQRDEKQANLKGLKELCQMKDQKIGAGEGLIKQKRDYVEQLRDKTHKTDMDKQQIKLRMDGIMSRLITEYKQETDQIKPDTPSLSQDKRKGLLEDIHRKKTTFESLGAVNLTAPEEYEELKKRYDFLVEQQNDLQTAKHDLNSLIQQIDTTTCSMFKEAFETINKNFSHLFSQLFDGGYGELRQIGSADKDTLEEIGIDVVAQPPGKRLSSITLLSGGERSLSAICLLFAIFEFKPSPFSILDEVDAALDEPNVLRLNKFITDNSKRSQFLLITHNPRTIESADTLYGITMEEAGVSRVISVALKKRGYK